MDKYWFFPLLIDRYRSLTILFFFLINYIYVTFTTNGFLCKFNKMFIISLDIRFIATKQYLNSSIKLQMNSVVKKIVKIGRNR